MTGDPIIEFRGVEKALGESFPLRIDRFILSESERVVLGGLPGSMGEAMMNLITGASLPDRGDVIVFGKNTREIRTDTEWLTSLDRFGLVSNRAVLLDQSTIAQNLALPISLSIDPMPSDVRARVEALAAEVGLPLNDLDRPPEIAYQGSWQRTRMHLARALAHQPQVLLLENPTASFLGFPSDKLGATVRTIVDTRKLSMLAVTEDDRFARSSGGRRYRVERDGSIRPAGFALRRFFFFGWGG
ncbi:MAG: ATP-binding cassette domain-containing protein [Acidobacteria bacterium]|nr:MAG: ATP-binding cassette domain-containing protein [Acidobacteriota bacterium]